MIEILNILLFFDDALKEAIQNYSQKLLIDPAKSWENKWYLAQYGEAFQNGQMPDLDICYIDDFFGAGVFAKEPIAPHTYICPYLGIVRKRDQKRDLQNDYIFDYPINTVIDAKDKGGICRYFNHSDTPNLTAHWMVIDGLYHIIFYANQAIQPSQQLTFNYGSRFWRIHK